MVFHNAQMRAYARSSVEASAMAQDDLLFMTASRAAMLIRMRKLSPVEYLEAILVAAHQQQGRLNCFTAILDEEARAACRAGCYGWCSTRPPAWRTHQHQGFIGREGCSDTSRFGDFR
jgi:hypothetical protein